MDVNMQHNTRSIRAIDSYKQRKVVALIFFKDKVDGWSKVWQVLASVGGRRKLLESELSENGCKVSYCKLHCNTTNSEPYF